MGYPNGWMLENCWKIPKMDDDWGQAYDLGNPHVATPKHDGILMNSLILDDLAGIRMI
jgi:hypothetical protein